MKSQRMARGKAFILKCVQAVFACIGCSAVYQPVMAAPNGYLLKINLVPALCRIDDSFRNSRQCMEGYALTVTGLLPEGVNTRKCATSSNANLSPVQNRLLTRIMPDENDRVRLWRAVGGCVGTTANQYFRSMINNAEHLKVPPEVTPPNSVRVNRMALKARFVDLNPGLTVDGINFNCMPDRNNTMLLTHINVCYLPNGRFRACSGARVVTCPNTVTIQGNY